MIDVLVLGGGWAGVVFALEFRRGFPSASVAVVDRDFSGGLLGSVEVGGHVFDVGGSHVIFSRDGGVLGRMLALLGDNVVRHVRRAFVRLGGLYVPYPLENGLYALPPEERAEALVAFMEAWMARPPDWRPRTFRDWVWGFGRWIAERYLEPYNLKIWKRPLEELDVDWVYTPGRLPVPDWRDVARAAAGVPTVGYAEQASFYYPARGGIKALYDAALNEAVRLGARLIRMEVSQVRKTADGWLVNGVKARRIVNTIPLKELVEAMDAPGEVRRAAAELDHNMVAVVGLALDRPAPDQHWVYVPQPDVPFHRYAWLSNYGQNAPPGRSTLIAEITVPPWERADPQDLVEKTVEGFEALGLLDRRDVLFARAWTHEYGYPVYRLGHTQRRQTVTQWLEEQGITTTGRWGAWHYWNTDKIYAEIIKKIILYNNI